MSRAVYRCGLHEARRRRALLYHLARPELDGRCCPATREALTELREDVLTGRELECMEHYYVRQSGLEAIAAELGIVPSTVSRSIRRGEKKLDALLRLAVEISPLRLPPVLDIRPAGGDRG